MTTTPVAVSAGCSWPIDPSCFEDEFDGLEDDIRERAVSLASLTLARLTGYRVGGCPITVRPSVRSCWNTSFASYYDVLGPGGGGISGFWPVNISGVWVNVCGHGSDCLCQVNRCVVYLPQPIGRIDEVKVDGAVVDPTDYRLTSRGGLAWIGGGDCPWPTCQDLSLPDTEDGTFSVTYLNAYPVDTIGAYAAGILALEFAKACKAPNKCRLPATVQRITRAGVSYDISAGAFPGGTTGIREVDEFVALWNPRHSRQPSVVWSP